jgi:hypothetical protein
MNAGFPVSVWDRPFGNRAPGEELDWMTAADVGRAERRRLAAAIRRDQDARAARIGPTATRKRLEAGRLEEQARRLRAEIGPATPTTWDDGVDRLEASGIVELHGWSGSMTAPLVSRIRGEQVADLTIGVTLNRIGERIHESVREGGVTERVSVVSYEAVITVAISDGRSGTADCFTREITEKIIIRPHGGSQAALVAHDSATSRAPGRRLVE